MKPLASLAVLMVVLLPACGTASPSLRGATAGDAFEPDPLLVEVEVDPRVPIDPRSQMPVIVLREIGGDGYLPIWIGVFEANAIAMVLEEVEPPRPMTHDLLGSVIRRLDGRVERVVVTELREGTYYAEIHLLRDGEPIVVDSRPSDAIALALRAGAPILVNRTMLERADDDDQLIT